MKHFSVNIFLILGNFGGSFFGTVKDMVNLIQSPVQIIFNRRSKKNFKNNWSKPVIRKFLSKFIIQGNIADPHKTLETTIVNSSSNIYFETLSSSQVDDTDQQDINNTNYLFENGKDSFSRRDISTHSIVENVKKSLPPPISFKKFRLLSFVIFELGYFRFIQDSTRISAIIKRIQGRIETLKIIHVMVSISENCVISSRKLAGPILYEGRIETLKLSDLMESSSRNCENTSRHFAVPIFLIKEKIENLDTFNKMESNSQDCIRPSRQLAKIILSSEKISNIKKLKRFRLKNTNTMKTYQIK